jgi:hypothetical protein
VLADTTPSPGRTPIKVSCVLVTVLHNFAPSQIVSSQLDVLNTTCAHVEVPVHKPERCHMRTLQQCTQI